MTFSLTELPYIYPFPNKKLVSSRVSQTTIKQQMSSWKAHCKCVLSHCVASALHHCCWFFFQSNPSADGETVKQQAGKIFCDVLEFAPQLLYDIIIVHIQQIISQLLFLIIVNALLEQNKQDAAVFNNVQSSWTFSCCWMQELWCIVIYCISLCSTSQSS